MNVRWTDSTVCAVNHKLYYWNSAYKFCDYRLILTFLAIVMLTGIYFLIYNFLTAVNAAFKINSAKEKLLAAPNNSLLWKNLLIVYKRK